MTTLPDWLQALLSSAWLPAVLFLGTFGDACLLTSLMIFGEIFFIACGYVIASTQHWWLLLPLWSGALLGDAASYFIGKSVGVRLAYRLIARRPKLRLNYYRAQRFIKEKGVISIFIARITGPIAKFMPFLAGVAKLRFVPFLGASLAGILVGSLQFLLIGWLLASGINYRHLIFAWIKMHWLLSGGILLTALFLIFFTWNVYKKIRST